MKLLYSEQEFFCTKTEFSNFKITLPSAKLDMVGSRLVLSGLIFSDDIPSISVMPLIYNTCPIL